MTRLLRAVGRERGYTLVEMLTVLVILTTVMAALVTLFVRATNAEMGMNNRWQAQQNARVSLDKLRREIHCASTVTKGSAGTPAGPLAAQSITIALPSGCRGGGVNVTWCTKGSGARWALYRVNNSSTCTGGTKYADYLTAPNIFDYTVTSGSLAKVNVDLPVQIDPRKGVEAYELKDDIVLRNSVRAS